MDRRPSEFIERKGGFSFVQLDKVKEKRPDILRRFDQGLRRTSDLVQPSAS